MARRLLLDTDTGVDDALAICLAMRSPELQVEGITAVHGNVPVDMAAANILRALDVLDPPVGPPVSRGAEKPLRVPRRHAQDVHGQDGLGSATLLRDARGRLRYPPSARTLDPRTAVELMLESAARFPGALTLVAVGPLTNVALAIQADPDRMRQLQEIVVMGGAFRRQGNMSPVAEFNIFADPHAAEIVFDFDVPVTIIPLDVTEQTVLDRETVERHADHSLGCFIRDITAQTMDFGERVEGIRGCYMHDVLAVAYLVCPEAFRWVERHVWVETEGKVTLGQTVADLREPPRFFEPPNARIALQVEAERLKRLFVARVLQA